MRKWKVDKKSDALVTTCSNSKKDKAPSPSMSLSSRTFWQIIASSSELNPLRTRCLQVCSKSLRPSTPSSSKSIFF